MITSGTKLAAIAIIRHFNIGTPLILGNKVKAFGSNRSHIPQESLDNSIK